MFITFFDVKVFVASPLHDWLRLPIRVYQIVVATYHTARPGSGKNILEDLYEALGGRGCRHRCKQIKHTIILRSRILSMLRKNFFAISDN